MRRARILIVDRDRDAAAALRVELARRRFEVGDAESLPLAFASAPGFAPDAVLARIDAEQDAAELARTLAAQRCDASVVALVAPSAMSVAVAAMRAGAASFLVAPADPERAALALEKALETRHLRRDGAALREELRRRNAIVGSAPEISHAREVVRRAAPTRATVLVVGEAGAGRDLVAQALHDLSPRRDAPFVRASCAAASEALLDSDLFGCESGALPDADARRAGALERADGGTLFVDEVWQLSPRLQIKLLRVLQHGEHERVGGREVQRVDVRLVVASTRDLADEVRAGRFRDDLYYRLNVVSVALPPLRDRKGDVPALVEHFLARSAEARRKGVRGLTPGALSLLFAYGWPGNVAELATVVGEAVAACDGRDIGVEHLSPALRGARPDERGQSALPAGATLFEIEREAILRTLDQVDGSTARAAEILGISVRKVQYRLKEYGARRSVLAARVAGR
jgi:two-component system, NtrC family, response regulator HydG